MTTTKRIDYLDILKGIGIFLMVFDHVYWGQLVHTYIQSFHMPLFFFISGYLWKGNSINKTVTNKIKTLLIPYIIYGLLQYVLWIFLFGIKHNLNLLVPLKTLFWTNTDIDNMPIAPALWFLTCLFIVSVFFNIVRNVIKNEKIFFIAMCSISILGSVYPLLTKIHLPYAMDSAMTGIGFYTIGYYMKHLLEKKNEKVDITNINTYMIGILLIIDVILTFSNGCIDMRSTRYYIIPLFWINATLGTIIYWNISKKLSTCSINLFQNISKIFKYLGINSIIFLCLNQLCILIYGKAISKIFNLLSIGENHITKFASKSSIFILTIITLAIIAEILKHKRIKILISIAVVLMILGYGYYAKEKLKSLNLNNKFELAFNIPQKDNFQSIVYKDDIFYAGFDVGQGEGIIREYDTKGNFIKETGKLAIGHSAGLAFRKSNGHIYACNGGMYPSFIYEIDMKSETPTIINTLNYNSLGNSALLAIDNDRDLLIVHTATNDSTNPTFSICKFDGTILHQFTIPNKGVPQGLDYYQNQIYYIQTTRLRLWI
jgi:fucose 4-O-acetylase-like acetyltransferase